MNTGRPTLGTLRRISSTRPAAPVGERCEMCSEPIGDEHQHVVDVRSRAMMCTCRPCYLLFTDQHADLRYRAVPDRYLSFPGFTLARTDWEDLQIPVGLAFRHVQQTDAQPLVPSTFKDMLLVGPEKK